MNLMEESFQTKEEKKSKVLPKVILGAILLTVIIIIAVIAYMASINQKQLRVYVNNMSNTNIVNILTIEEDGTVLVPIKLIASQLGYNGYNGSYVDKSEVSNKCYVDTENEITNFELGSKKMYKLDLSSKADTYTYVHLDREVEARVPNGSVNNQRELFTTSTAIQKALNIQFDYDKEKNIINIFTLPYLYEFYNNEVLQWQYQSVDSAFSNQKAILDGYLVVVGTNGKKGVLDISGNVIFEAKYSNITYIPEIGDFLVQDNGKVGIMSKNSREPKIQLVYDEIKLLDQDAGLYVAKKDGQYGVLDIRGNVKIYFENDEIGIDTSKFTENGIMNKYVLVNNLIPVKRDDYWALYNLRGQQVVDFVYDSFGYVAASSRNAFNLLEIPDYEVIVACKNDKYTLLNKYGEELFVDAIADDIYMTIDGEGTHYYISANNQTIDAEQYLDKIGVKEDMRSRDNSATNNQSTNTTTNQDQQQEQQNDQQAMNQEGQNVQNNQEQNPEQQQNNQQVMQQDNNQQVYEEQNNQQIQQNVQEMQQDNSGVIQSNQGVILGQ